MESWGSMRPDFVWLAENIIYGMFLSEDSILTTIETGLMSYAAISAQDLPGPTKRHMKGLRRFGVSREELRAVVECAKLMMAWVGRDLEDWIEVKDIGEEEDDHKGEVCKS